MSLLLSHGRVCRRRKVAGSNFPPVTLGAELKAVGSDQAVVEEGRRGRNGVFSGRGRVTDLTVSGKIYVDDLAFVCTSKYLEEVDPTQHEEGSRR